jgi:hypothetical protein
VLVSDSGCVYGDDKRALLNAIAVNRKQKDEFALSTHRELSSNTGEILAISFPSIFFFFREIKSG